MMLTFFVLLGFALILTPLLVGTVKKTGPESGA
jgi:hypothetical protein